MSWTRRSAPRYPATVRSTRRCGALLHSSLMHRRSGREGVGAVQEPSQDHAALPPAGRRRASVHVLALLDDGLGLSQCGLQVLSLNAHSCISPSNFGTRLERRRPAGEVADPCQSSRSASALVL